MVVLLTVVGIVLFVLGLLFSIAWHELGHMSTAKMFGIKCTEFMVGFGRTLWSVRRGETEYGIKAVPLGGFVRMVGMLPPARARAGAGARKISRWRAMAEDAREASYVELSPEDQDRQFYQRAPWKRLIVMFAGPAMNLVLAVVLLGVLFMGIGVPKDVPQLGAVRECVVPAQVTATECSDEFAPTPAHEAGLEPGDTIVSIDGEPTPDGATVNRAIRASLGPTEFVIERDGEQFTTTVDIVENELAARNADGDPVYETDAEGDLVYDEQGRRVVATETVGFLGVLFTQERQPLTVTESASEMGSMLVSVGEAIIALPSRVPEVFGAAFLGEQRTEDSPVGIVGISRIGGEIMSQGLPLIDTVAIMLSILASVNLFLFAFNMLPILPLDGGHMAGAIWESVKRWTARLFRRPDPGPVDVALLTPVAYVVVACFLVFSVILLVADLINPVRLFG
ncbi:putative zinc metalloprotease [Nocardiopsis terrae]|uniref:Membrane-associated protease RseP (Regulator of RpoE activity) n=1 Tax=Nocardiopsis terrae TaxID=372655 RepID=A0ABR9HCI8_9ACTN|nr:site-2 protease family protein [Nocardiopsis terrae]MBE1456734.1 membrane-associated protease RseP (regulator of RpoE activity) [Nocardiopsis terrae]GHC75376.1 putative zinc metalloprotease [Nocardiopsis terrae]